MSHKVSIASCITAASLIGFVLIEGIREQQILVAEFGRSRAELATTLLRPSLEDPGLWERPEALQAFVERLAAPPSNGFIPPPQPSQLGGELDILVLGADRLILAGTTPEQLGKRYASDPEGEIDQTMADGRARRFMESGVSPAVWVVVPLTVGPVTRGILLIRSPSEAVADRAQKLVREVAREAILVATLALLLILWMTRRFLLRPIGLLKAGAVAWEKGNLAHRISFSGADELGDLRDAFNEMATTLETQRLTLARKQADLEESVRQNREAQAQLVQSEKLASVGTLAAGIAHELNQPLMLIRGYAQRLLSRANDAVPKAREEIKIIEEETARMMTIIRHVKDFSRKSTGEYQEVDINTIIRSSLALLSKRFHLQRIEVRLNLDQTLPHVWGDPIQLAQVFVNLITNARDALDEVGGGALTVQSCRGQHNSVEVSFVDTGPGIEPAILPRIFDPFFTTKPVGSGTGLGLSIALGLVQAHGGQIAVDSESGHGARFTISLPGGGTPKGESRSDHGRR